LTLLPLFTNFTQNSTVKMNLIFKYGFQYDGFLYGWNKKELYRLPSKSGNKSYGLKKLEQIKVGNSSGYRLKGAKLSIFQLKQLTAEIEEMTFQLLDDCVDIP